MLPSAGTLRSFHLVNMDLTFCFRRNSHPHWARTDPVHVFCGSLNTYLLIIFKVSPFLLVCAVNYMVTLSCSVQKWLFLWNCPDSTKSSPLLFILIAHPISFFAVVITVIIKMGHCMTSCVFSPLGCKLSEDESWAVLPHWFCSIGLV